MQIWSFNMGLLNIIQEEKNYVEFEEPAVLKPENAFSDLCGDASIRSQAKNPHMWKMAHLDRNKIQEHRFVEL